MTRRKKSRAGRPAKPAADRRDQSVQVLLTPAELAAVTAVVAAENDAVDDGKPATPASWIRDLALDKIADVRWCALVDSVHAGVDSDGGVWIYDPAGDHEGPFTSMAAALEAALADEDRIDHLPRSQQDEVQPVPRRSA